MTSEPVPAHVIAQFDQKFAESEKYLGDILAAYLSAWQSDEAEGIPEAFTITELAAELTNATTEQLASIAAVAIVAIARSMTRTDPEQIP